MGKRKLIFVSHTHWDREWYLSHARHNYRLVKFMDALIDTLVNDSAFRSFHLDGQVVILEDYLAVRPEKEDIIRKLIANGRLKIGPFYILQDEYLVSGEASIRNVLYGLKTAKKYGEPTLCGYFPDAFGNISQIPQLMRGFGIDNVFFGRGIIPTGYANEVLGRSEEGFSEIIWQGADGSEIIGIQFVNWYNNGNEIPSEPQAAAERIRAIAAASEFSSRAPVLLAMNGCDHQPVQKNLPQILRQVQPMLDDIELAHASLEEYIAQVRPYKEKFYRYTGEICGANGNGYGTLVNTASTRVYLKQLNQRAECLLESELEPLMSLYGKMGGNYDRSLLEFLWKKLLKNHPHDSICGCSCDEVCRKMEVRFDDVLSAATDVKADVLQAIADKAQADSDDGPGAKKGICVVNTGIHAESGWLEVDVDYTADETVPTVPVLTLNGQTIPCLEKERKKRTIFTLPEDSFRRVFEVTTLSLRFYLQQVPALSVQTYAVEDAALPQENTAAQVGLGGDVRVQEKGKTVENALVKLVFHKNGSFDLTDKRNGKVYRRLNLLEAQRDVGHEYEFVAQGDVQTTAEQKAEISVSTQRDDCAEIVVTTALFGVKICSTICLQANSARVGVTTTVTNVQTNWRLRTTADSGMCNRYVTAYGQFDCVKRTVRPGDKWRNPSNCQRFDGYFYLGEKSGLGIAARGLNEYEVTEKPADGLYTGDKMAVTLLRAVGEVGDWFYFPTPEAQVQRTIVAEYAFIPFLTPDEISCEAESYVRPKLHCAVTAHAAHAPLLPMGAVQIDGNVQISALKRAEDNDGWILRVFNPSETPSAITTALPARIVRLDESNSEDDSRGNARSDTFTIAPKKILSLKFGL